MREVIGALAAAAPSPFRWDEIAATTRATFAMLESARSGRAVSLGADTA